MKKGSAAVSYLCLALLAVLATQTRFTSAQTCAPPPALVTGTNTEFSYNLPPQPTLNVQMEGTSDIVFALDLSFVQDDASYMFDFVPRDFTDPAERNLTHPFSNRDFQGSFASQWLSPEKVDDIWAHANYSTYPVTFGNWTLASANNASDCNKLSWKGKWDFWRGLSDAKVTLLNGQNVSVLNFTDTANELIFSGRLYVTLLRATSRLNNNLVDSLSTWQYPFQIRMQKLASAVSVMTVYSDTYFFPRISPQNIGLLQSGSLALDFITELKEALDSPDANNTDVAAGNPQSSGPVPLATSYVIPTSACVSPCTQSWRFVSQEVRQVYSGNYTFSFEVLGINISKRYTEGRVFTVTMAVEMETKPVIVVNGTITSSVLVSKTGFGGTPSNSYSAEELVYVAHQFYAYSNTFNPVLHNAWFCYGLTEGQACSTVSGSQSVQLVANGVAQSSGAAKSFATLVVPSRFFSAFSFRAHPLSNTTEVYTLEVQSLMQPITQGRKRATTSINGVPAESKLTTFTILAAESTEETTPEIPFGTSAANVSTKGSALIVAAALLAGLIGRELAYL